MSNPGTVDAKYIVFEFHGTYAPPDTRNKRTSRSFLTKLTDPKSWRRKLRQVLGV